MIGKDGNLEKTGIEIQGIPDFVNSAIRPINEKLIFQTDRKQYEIAYNPDDFNIENELPQKIVANLYNFQKQGVQFGLANCCRVLIADEMGVGKTIQAICLASCYKSAWPLMIICPSSLKYNWKEEIVKWAYPPLKEMQVQILSKQAEEIYIMTRVLIVSYDLAPKIEEKIKRFKTNIVIADEAHYLKNAQAKRTNTLLPILQKIKHVILLTGTPAFARPKEMFTLLSIIRPDIFKVFRNFGDRYCDPKPAKFGGGIDYTGSSNEKELFYILKKTMMIRRLKQDVLSQLPKKRRKKVHVNVDPKILSEIQAILNQTNKSSLEQLFDQAQKQNDQNNEGQNGSSSSMFSALSLCYQLSGQAKLHELKNYIKDLLENDIKIIVFAHHQEMLNQIENFINNELSLKFIRIDGKVAPKERHERVQQFQTDPEVKVAILSLQAASTGLTLTASSNIVFAEMNWTPAIMQQAEDRAHRIGQENSVLCHYILGEKTLDDYLYKKIEQKIAVVSNILDGESKELKIDEVQKAENENQPLDYGENNLNIEDDIQDSLSGATQMTQQRQMTQAQFLKQLIEEKENKKLLESQMSNQNSNTEPTTNLNELQQLVQKPFFQMLVKMQVSDSSDDSDDDEELFIMKMIAAQSAKNLKEKQNQVQSSSVVDNGIKSTKEEKIIEEAINQQQQKSNIDPKQFEKKIFNLIEAESDSENENQKINYQIKINGEQKISQSNMKNQAPNINQKMSNTSNKPKSAQKIVDQKLSNNIKKENEQFQKQQNKPPEKIQNVNQNHLFSFAAEDFIYEENDVIQFQQKQNLSFQKTKSSVDTFNFSEKKQSEDLYLTDHDEHKILNSNLKPKLSDKKNQDLHSFAEFTFCSSSKIQGNLLKKKTEPPVSDLKKNFENQLQINKNDKQTPKDNKKIPQNQKDSVKKADTNQKQMDLYYYDDEDYSNNPQQNLKANSFDSQNSQSKPSNTVVNLTQKQKKFLRAEKYKDGIKKIIFDDGDVQYISSSEDLEQFYSKNLESKVELTNTRKEEKPNCNEDSDDEIFSFLDQNFGSKQQSNSNLSSKNKQNPQVNQSPERNVRKRDEFEQDFAQKNGISQQDSDFLFNQFQPEKQQSISKKSLIKLAKQHF